MLRGRAAAVHVRVLPLAHRACWSLPVSALASALARSRRGAAAGAPAARARALAARVAEGDLSVRIADRSGDEIGRLAERLDRMTERLAEARDPLEANDRQRRQLFADITHELATPLTSIRGYAETLLDPDVAVTDRGAHALRARRARGVAAARPADPRPVRAGAARGRRHAARAAVARLGGAVPQHRSSGSSRASARPGSRSRGAARRPRRGSRPTATGWSRCSRICSSNALRYVPRAARSSCRWRAQRRRARRRLVRRSATVR